MTEKFEEWLSRYQQERNPAANTVRAIRSVVPRFLRFAQEKGRGTLDEITREDVIDFLNSQEARTSSKKIEERYITLFFNRAADYGLRVERLPVIGYRGPTDVPRAISKDLPRPSFKP